jgi:hypothetical protein
MFDKGITMKRKPYGIFLVLILLFALTTDSLCSEKHDYQTGKLVDISADEVLDNGDSTRWAIFTLQIRDLVYTARGARIRRHGGDSGQGLIVGDPVSVCVNGESLILLKPDGKEIKAKILKRERVQ